MRKWAKTTAFLFLVAVSVYSDRATAADPAIPVKSAVADASTAPVLTVDPIPVDPKKNPPVVTMNDSGIFSIQISNDVNLIDVLRMIAAKAQISIIPSKEVHGTVPAMDLYNVTVHDALDAILQTNGMAYRQKGNFIFVYSQHELLDMEKAARVAATEVFHLHYTTASDADKMIKPVLSSDAKDTFSAASPGGLTTGITDVGADSDSNQEVLVVTDYPENLDKVAKILKEVDRRPQQVLIEATILQASLNENNALGIDFTILGGTDFTTLMNPAGAAATAGAALTGNILNSTTAGPLLNKGYAGGGTSFSTQIPQGGLEVGVVHDNLAFFLQALESITDTTILANPKILALDKQKGEVIVGRQDGYLTTTTTQTATSQTVEFLETGTRLVFRPYIADDGFIRMEIHPEDSSGGLTSTNLPFKITTEVTSNVMVKDGNTIVIGGLFRESSTVTKAEVPFLGSLPLVRALFRQQQDATSRQEVIILLTPHIVKDDSAYAKASEEELKEMDRLRVGVRREMMITGRERLAENDYEDAVAEMKKPNPNVCAALWHLDCATNLSPEFIEAIHMKEQLTGKVITEADHSTIRSFVRRQIMAESTGQPSTQPSIPAPIEPKGAFISISKPSTRPDIDPVVAPLLPSTQPATALTLAPSPTTQPDAPFTVAPRGPANDIHVLDDFDAQGWPTTLPSASAGQ